MKASISPLGKDLMTDPGKAYESLGMNPLLAKIAALLTPDPMNPLAIGAAYSPEKQAEIARMLLQKYPKQGSLLEGAEAVGKAASPKAEAIQELLKKKAQADTTRKIAPPPGQKADLGPLFSQDPKGLLSALAAFLGMRGMQQPKTSGQPIEATGDD